jgi:hypothetical protein
MNNNINPIVTVSFLWNNSAGGYDRAPWHLKPVHTIDVALTEIARRNGHDITAYAAAVPAVPVRKARRVRRSKMVEGGCDAAE